MTSRLLACWQRVTVVPYAVTLVMLNGFIGVLRLWESPNRTASPAYHAASLLPFPIRAWGALFLLVAVLVAVSNGRGWALQLACLIGATTWFFWAGMLAISAYTTGRSSYVGAVLYAAGGIRCWQVVAAPDVWRKLWRRLRACFT